MHWRRSSTEPHRPERRRATASTSEKYRASNEATAPGIALEQAQARYRSAARVARIDSARTASAGIRLARYAANTSPLRTRRGQRRRPWASARAKGVSDRVAAPGPGMGAIEAGWPVAYTHGLTSSPGESFPRAPRLDPASRRVGRLVARAAARVCLFCRVSRRGQLHHVHDLVEDCHATRHLHRALPGDPRRAPDALGV